VIVDAIVGIAGTIEERLMRLDSPVLPQTGGREAEIDDDARLMLRFKEGDVGAFECLFSRHAKALVSFAYRFVRNRDTAEELAQEVFLRVHDAASSYRVEAKFTTWLYRIATNVCLNELRRPRFRAAHESLDVLAGEDPDTRPADLADKKALSPEAELGRRDLARQIARALERLPEKQRAAFVLNKYQELSYLEVAEAMNTSEKAVKSLIHRAKERIASALAPLMVELLR
jgi:RNA polymerase sigma-70 factor, ECF subfamily